MGELGWPNSPSPPLFTCVAGKDSVGAQFVRFVVSGNSGSIHFLPSTPCPLYGPWLLMRYILKHSVTLSAEFALGTHLQVD
jgi:hypothetical protein